WTDHDKFCQLNLEHAKCPIIHVPEGPCDGYIDTNTQECIPVTATSEPLTPPPEPTPEPTPIALALSPTPEPTPEPTPIVPDPADPVDLCSIDPTGPDCETPVEPVALPLVGENTEVPNEP